MCLSLQVAETGMVYATVSISNQPRVTARPTPIGGEVRTPIRGEVRDSGTAVMYSTVAMSLI